MSPWTDLKDWVGGYPYEVATVERLVSFAEGEGFQVEQIRRSSGLGNNELLLRRAAATPPPGGA
jgi:2-polyprenyl-6-hydroxyphenyl methylase/3-demethylubiquinone-9 3-methyltransferase